MRAWLLCLFCLAGPASAEKVFVAALTPGAGADPAEVALVDERLLASLRRLPGLEVVGARDVTTMLDLEAVKQQAGCTDGVSCAAEVAGALDAPMLITGQLGQVGQTWVLSLSRMDQRSLQVVARVTREVQGTGADAVFTVLDGQVDELFGRGPDLWGLSGGVGLGVGSLGLVGAVVLGAVSWNTFNTAQAALEDANTDDPATVRAEAQRLGNGLNAAAITSGVVGALGVVVGGSLLTVGAIGGGE
jgi:hypothetical protein